MKKGHGVFEEFVTSVLIVHVPLVLTWSALCSILLWLDTSLKSK